MDTSVSRKNTIERHLKEVKLPYIRVRGITPKEIYIPPDVDKTWLNRHCVLETSWNPNNASTISPSAVPYDNHKFAMAAMCGRKKNTVKEIGCSVSHLYAMREAIYSKTAKSPYALIVEDDVFFPFDIDFNALAATAPTDFGILQLFNSNQPSMRHIYDKYRRNNNNLWLKRNAASFEFWSTCAYLINREVMRPVIDAVVLTKRVPGVMEFKLAAGVTHPCTPSQCCTDPTKPNAFQVAPPCVYAPRGYQADSFLYAMTKTYMLSFPVITNGGGGNQSTFHQFHVELLHRNAFKQQREFVNEMLSGKIPTPPSVNKACNSMDVEFL